VDQPSKPSRLFTSGQRGSAGSAVTLRPWAHYQPRRLTRDEYNALRRQLDDLDAKLASLRQAERESRR
jgi:hypothetical protein